MKRSGWFLGVFLGVVFAAAAISSSGFATADNKLGAGAECKYNSDCASSNCDHNKCKPKSGEKLGNGAECKYNSDCSSGNCDHDHCKPKGGEKLANGMSCKYNSDCASGDCDHNKCKGR